MKLILTKSLHKKHFWPNWIRNKLFHWEITKYIYSLDKSDIDELYKKLINYISSKYKVKLKENIKFIWRNENSTAIYQIREFKSLKLWLKLWKIEKNTKVISKKISINGYQKISSANTFYNKPTSP